MFFSFLIRVSLGYIILAQEILLQETPNFVNTRKDFCNTVVAKVLLYHPSGVRHSERKTPS